MAKQARWGMQRPPVMRLIAVQFIILLVISLAWLGSGRVSALSALLGGLIFLIPNAYFAHKTFAHQGARAARQIVGAFYRGEAGKLILAAVLFALVFRFVRPLDEAALFLAFAAMLATNWLTPLILGHHHRGQKHSNGI